MLNITNHLIVSALFSLAGFILAMGLTPLYTFFAYKYEFWKVFEKLVAQKIRLATKLVEKLEPAKRLSAEGMSTTRRLVAMSVLVAEIRRNML